MFRSNVFDNLRYKAKILVSYSWLNRFCLHKNYSGDDNDNTKTYRPVKLEYKWPTFIKSIEYLYIACYF